MFEYVFTGGNAVVAHVNQLHLVFFGFGGSLLLLRIGQTASLKDEQMPSDSHMARGDLQAVFQTANGLGQFPVDG